MSNGLEKYPKLRFPGFEEPWTETAFSSFSAINPKSENLPDKFIYIDLESVLSGELQSEKIEFAQTAPSRAQRTLIKNDVLFQTVRPYQQNNYFYTNTNINNLPCVASTGYAVFRTKNNAKFLYALIHTNSFLADILKRCTGSNYPSINGYDIENITIFYPSLQEQEKIGDFMSLIDKKIRKTKLLIKALKKYKRGLRQQVFPQKGETTPKLRFAGFTVPWEQHKVKNIAPLQRGFDLPTSQIEEGIYPVIMSNGIGGYHSHFKVKGPGIITGRSGTIGKLHYIESDYWPHNTTLWITDFYGNNQKFIYYMYQHLDLSRFSTGSGVPTLNRNDVHNELVWIPSVREQERISEHLTNLDRLITLHQRKLSKFQTLKSALLQQLFI